MPYDCYICGSPIMRGEGRRRIVPTGFSRWSHSGRGGSKVAYSGLRTVCRACARRQDRAGLIKAGIFAILGLIVILWSLYYRGLLN